jgi:hypothetical protein
LSSSAARSSRVFGGVDREHEALAHALGEAPDTLFAAVRELRSETIAPYLPERGGAIPGGGAAANLDSTVVVDSESAR